MKLIADSGSTKTSWVLAGEQGEVLCRIETQGITPVHQSADQISRIIADELIPGLGSAFVVDHCKQDSEKANKGFASVLTSCNQPSHSMTEIYFYGSGTTREKAPEVCQILYRFFPLAKVISAKSDLLGAARALCGHSEGIACILGTGANSCVYDGKKIVRNTPALGYILGDEGSGAVLGRSFVNALYKGILPKEIKEDFEKRSGLSQSAIIERVYRQPMANRFLASLTKYIPYYIYNSEVETVVTENFFNFIEKNLAPYNCQHLPVNAVGSIAYYFRTQLEFALRKRGYLPGTIVRNPIDSLVKYHTNPGETPLQEE